MTDFFREVQEDLQRDRLLKLWKRFRWPLLGLIVAIVAAVIVIVVLRGASDARNEKDGGRYAEASKLLSDGKDGEAAKAFNALATEATGGYAALARLREADIKAKGGDVDGAVAALDALAKDSRVDRVYRDLAALVASERLIDKAPLEDIMSRLSHLLAPDSSWRWLATELKGVAELKAGKTEEARATFTELVENNATAAGVRFRAAELLSGLGGPLPKKDAAAAPDGAKPAEAKSESGSEAKPAETPASDVKPADSAPATEGNQ